MGAQCCSEVKLGGLQQMSKHLQYQYKETVWPQNDQYITKYLENNKYLNQLPKKHQNSNTYYCGQQKDHQPQGDGILYQPGKFLYQGTFHRGTPQGKGVIKYLESDCQYLGQVKDGTANGQGTFKNPKANYTFTGQWVNSIPKSGKVVFDQDGTVIQFDNYQSKQAIIIYKDGKKYNGHIHQKSFAPNGKGTVKFPDGSWYIGSWKEGKMHGDGCFIWTVNKNGVNVEQRYDGQYVQGKKQGKGKFIFASGNVYEGNWQNGKMHGQGTLKDNKGILLKQGVWVDGKFDHKKQVLYKNQSKIQVQMNGNNYNN